jgi:hypothetical protein
MIDLKTESTLSLAQAARIVPPTRLDKPVHVSTIVRWILHGVRGVRLEAVRIGGRWITSHEALERFTAALTANHTSSSPQPSNPPRPTSAARQRKQERVDRELSALGV